MPQTMRCIFCYNDSILVSNAKAHAMKGFILYNIINGITTLKKHVFANCFNIAKMFEEEVNSVVRGESERQLAKKRLNLSSNVISNFFSQKDPFKKKDV